MKEFEATSWNSDNQGRTIVTVNIETIRDLPIKNERIKVDGDTYTTIEPHHQTIAGSLYGTAAITIK